MEMIVFGTGMLVLAAGVCLYGRQKERRLLERLESMLEKARSGSFRQEEIDETMVSSVENSMARFLEDSRLAEENMNQRKERVQTMISDISHQTAIPISNILVYSQLLEEDCADPQMREYGTVIRQQGEKLQFLLDSLVKISRLENGIIQTVPQKGELGELACQVKSLMEQKAGEKQISLEVKSGKEMVYAWFDRKWTREALMNLVDNAVKYTPAGGKVTMEVVSYSLFSRIDVRDTGIGIEEEELPEIFHRFYRSRRVLSEEGVGLGLYLAGKLSGARVDISRFLQRKGREVSFPYFFLAKKEKMSPDCDISETVWRFFSAILSLTSVDKRLTLCTLRLKKIRACGFEV